VSHSELRFAIPSLSFLPGDINLLEGSPGVRRYFLDRVCSLCSPLYARRLAEYRRLVKARGALLRSAVPDDRALRACSVPLAGLGRWIREARSRASAMLEEKLSERLSASLSDLSPAPLALSPVWAGGADIEAWFASSANLERERHARSVLVGPHRDDLLVAVAGVQRSAAEVFSRGHKRRAVVAMILAAGRLVEGRLRKSPVLLLDDVTAELDTEGRELTGRALTETGWQVFAAGTEEGLFGRSATSAVLWRVREGRIDSR
jgi:DNA replication and repair protein RecF